jgi:hypothetical protein
MGINMLNSLTYLFQNFLSKISHYSQAWWFTPIILVTGIFRQGDCQFKTSMGYTVSLRAGWAKYQDYALNKQRNKQQQQKSHYR